MNRRTIAGVLVAAALSALPAAALAQEDEVAPVYYNGDENLGLGLFHSVSLAPFPSFRTGLGPRLPSSLAEGGVEFRVIQDWATVLSVQDEWLLDYDVQRASLGLSWAVTSRVRLDLDLEGGTRTGGYLDTFVIGFHRTFNLSIGNRRQYQDHPQRLQIQPPDGSPTVLIDETDEQPFQQAMIATAQYALVRGNSAEPAISAAVSVRRVLDQGDLSMGSAVDVAGSLSFAKSAGPVYFYLGGAVAWFGREELEGLPLRSIQWSGIVGVEVRATDWFSVVAQYLITSGGVDSMDDLSRPSHEIAAGFKWDLGKGYLLETAILENIINPFNSPDFGVHLSLVVRW